MTGGSLNANFKQKDKRILVDLKFRKKREWNSFLTNVFKPMCQGKMPALTSSRNKAITHNKRDQGEELQRKINQLEFKLRTIGKRITRAERCSNSSGSNSCKKRNTKENSKESKYKDSSSSNSSCCSSNSSNSESGNCSITCRNVKLKEQTLSGDIAEFQETLTVDDKPKIVKKKQVKDNSSESSSSSECKAEKQQKVTYNIQDIGTNELHRHEQTKNDEKDNMNKIKVLIDNAVASAISKAFDNYINPSINKYEKDKSSSTSLSQIFSDGDSIKSFNKDYNNKRTDMEENALEVKEAERQSNLNQQYQMKRGESYRVESKTINNFLDREEAQMSCIASCNVSSINVYGALFKETNIHDYQKIQSISNDANQYLNTSYQMQNPTEATSNNLVKVAIENEKNDKVEAPKIPECPSIKLKTDEQEPVPTLHKSDNSLLTLKPPVTTERSKEKEAHPRSLASSKKETKPYSAAYIKKKFLNKNTK